jgi:hypothetical protein
MGIEGAESKKFSLRETWGILRSAGGGTSDKRGLAAAGAVASFLIF